MLRHSRDIGMRLFLNQKCQFSVLNLNLDFKDKFGVFVCLLACLFVCLLGYLFCLFCLFLFLLNKNVSCAFLLYLMKEVREGTIDNPAVDWLPLLHTLTDRDLSWSE